MLDEHAGEHDSRPGSDSEDGRQEPDAARHPLARELVAHDAEREREDAATGSLDEARGDQQAEAARNGGEHGAGCEDPERPEEQPLLAVHVAEAAEDGRADRGGEQVGREQPGDAGLARVKVALDGRQRGHDHRAEHRVGDAADREHGQRHVRMGPIQRLAPYVLLDVTQRHVHRG